ncbi:sugar transport protein, partial [Cystoisospora suis]
MWDAQHIIGATAIFVAALATGSYAVPRKAEAVRRLQPPIENTIFIFYVCCGYAASTFLVCILLPFNQEIMDNYGVTSKLVFSWWGALSGALIVLAFNSGFVAISRLGLAMHSGISMGIAVVTSFLWGVLVNKDRLALLWVDVLAVVLLVTGSSLSAFHEELGTLTRSCRKDRKEECSSDSVEPVDIEESMPEARPLVGEHHATRRFRHFVGVCLSAISGACGGLSLGPMSFIPPAYKGIAFLPSFAAGWSSTETCGG